MRMITFERITLKERILEWLFVWRAYRRQQKLAAAIRYLVQHPEEPCSIEGIIVPAMSLPSHCGHCGAFLMGGATKHKPDCAFQTIINKHFGGPARGE